ncbi:hypothetical protein HYR54_06435 [Candidatus Acetothermia bacterium]|nr:hypothetical protein [Candidatus Acetothermia bacterium]MBI3459769.1 hypothetical protein [Candidatus Acetothermia bacterium]
MKKAIVTTVGTTLQPTNDFLERSFGELREECTQVLELLTQLRNLPEGDERDTFEGKLYASLSHLQLEAKDILKEWDRLTDRLPD